MHKLKLSQQEMSPDEKHQVKHDILNCLAILKGNVDMLSSEKNYKEMAADMTSAIEELEQKLPIILKY